MNTKTFIGIDAGGSRLRLAASNGAKQVEFEVAGVNLWRDGVATAGRNIAAAVNQAVSELEPAGQVHVVGGVAGALDSSRAAQLEDSVLQSVREIAVRRVRIISDIQLAHYAAHGESAGLTVAIGTGSVVFARSNSGEERVIGGWGYLIGDEGSGFAIGLASLRHVARAYDKGLTSTLAEILTQSSDQSMRPVLLHTAYREGARIQDLAPKVIEMAEAGNEDAKKIIDQQTKLLVNQILIALNVLDGVPARVSFVGGLSANGYYVDTVFGKLQSDSRRFERVTPIRRPLDQALAMAQRYAQA